jgi:predicted DNA-binding ribbon-helix-helix protein
MDKTDEEKSIYQKLRKLRRTRELTVNTLAEKIEENPLYRGLSFFTASYLFLDIARDTVPVRSS